MESTTKTPASALPDAAAYNFAAIDYARVVMAFLVITIHIAPLTSYSKLVNYGVVQYLARLGVPFFFFCNGFFLFRPHLTGNELRKNVSAQLKKLLLMNVFWTAVYMPLNIYAMTKRNDSALVECVRLVRGFILTGTYTQLWYLPASMLAIFLVWLTRERNFSWRSILLISGTLYAMGLCYQSWYGLPRKLSLLNIPAVYYPTKFFLKAMGTTRNGLFFGFLFVALGAYFAQRPLPAPHICRVGFAVSMLTGFAEALSVALLDFCRGWDMYIFLPFAVTFFVCALLQYPSTRKANTKALRKISSLIYFIHPWFIKLYSFAEKFLVFLPQNSLFKYCTVAACSVLFALAVMKISETKRFSWLKKIY